MAISLPGAESCRAAGEELRSAVTGLAQVADDLGDAIQRQSALLSAAIEVHDHEGDQVCPICAVGSLDAARANQLRSKLEEDEGQLTGLDRARKRQADAVTAARSLIASVPGVLDADLPDSVAGPASEVKEAWLAWAKAPAAPLDLGDHLSAKSEPLRAALERLHSVAETEANQRDETWSPVAARLAAHANAIDVWNQKKDEAAEATAAHNWLKAREDTLKNERVEPIADEAKKIWAGLRQESNVEIAGLELRGSKTRRHVVISAEVDGADAGALSVMSQGELHSLALALFLPRATMPDSPFRFVVLDDPVQAMDPAKVDGLVRVLLEIAKTRQVVVFSHDDRFASAVRRAPKGVPVKVLEVVREANSTVNCVVTFSPADRYMRDAFGLVQDVDLPDETRLQVLPGLLRMALEAQARESYFARELPRGVSHVDIERAWGEAKKTRERLALAIDDPTKVDVWLQKMHYRKYALKNANALHDQLAHDPKGACRDVERTIADLKVGAK